jgi:hypothetical protein
LPATPAGHTNSICQQPRNLLVGAGFAALAVAGTFIAGLQLGRYMAGPLEGVAIERAMDAQRLQINTARQQLEGQVDALAQRVGTLNGDLIRLNALGRRVTDLAGLDRGEFNFDETAPAGGPDDTDSSQASGSAQVPELTSVLDTLETQLRDQQRQFVVLESLMSMRELGERILPGGLPLIGGWISSRFGQRHDPFTGHTAFHKGVDFVGKPGSRVLAVGPGVVSYAGYKSGYGYVVEITHPTGAAHALRPQFAQSRSRGSDGNAGTGDRRDWQHRTLDRHACALRGRAGRQARQPHEVPRELSIGGNRRRRRRSTSRQAPAVVSFSRHAFRR